MSLDPDQKITTAVLTSISASLQLREPVPPVLINRAFTWAVDRITVLEFQARDATAAIDEARGALNPKERA